MINNNHPITPPPELVRQWNLNGSGTSEFIATQAARWGADQELQACCEAFEDIWDQEDVVTLNDVLRGIRAARRPKPPSLKEQGREALQSIHNAVVMGTGGRELDVLKEIVESLPD